MNINAQNSQSNISENNSLRKSLRSQRRRLSKIKQHRHTKIITQRIIHSPLYKHSKHIALYLSGDGEVDLMPLISKLHADSKKCYLPVILSKQNSIMAFAPYGEHTRLKKNCFDIPEPVFHKKDLKTVKQIDLVLAPLVGFDEYGNRIGMGGGFYDRALQHLNLSSTALRKPKLIGVAHELQKVTQLEAQSWDIALDAIVTERRLSYFHHYKQKEPLQTEVITTNQKKKNR